MNSRDLFIITLGFIIVGLGLALLSIGEGSAFFIFPFFFAGDLAPVFMISTLFIIMICFWWVNKNWVDDARFTHTQSSRPVYLRVGASCQFCGGPLPQNAAYCSSCGSAVERYYDDDPSF